MSENFVNWKIFEELPGKDVKIIQEEFNEPRTDSLNPENFVRSGSELAHENSAIRMPNFAMQMTTTITKSTKKFICEAPIGSGKSTAIRKWMVNTINKNKFILIVPTVNIAMEFYSKMYVELLNQTEEIDDTIKVCVRDKAFTEFREAINKFTPIVITTYSTASKCLGGIIESFYHKELQKSDPKGPAKRDKNNELIEYMELSLIEQYTLVIDEAHLLLENISLIEMCREFNNVALVSATISDISCLSVFKDFVRITPLTSKKYDRKIYVHKLKPTMDEQREIITKQVVTESKKYDKILIKVEDKNECDKLKKAIDDEFKKALYYSDKKEVEISDSGKFINPEDVDIIIATSCIQAGQSLKENLLQIFIQTPLDTISSVHQFIGRNRNTQSEAHLYLRCLTVPEDKFSSKISNNRYKTRLNQLRVNAWLKMDAESWKNSLSSMGEVILDSELKRLKEPKDLGSEPTKSGRTETEQNTTAELEVSGSSGEPQTGELFNGKDLNKEFRGKKKLYEYYNMKLKDIPSGYSIKVRVINEKGIRTRVYRLVIETNTEK